MSERVGRAGSWCGKGRGGKEAEDSNCHCIGYPNFRLISLIKGTHIVNKANSTQRFLKITISCVSNACPTARNPIYKLSSLSIGQIYPCTSTYFGDVDADAKKDVEKNVILKKSFCKSLFSFS